MDYKEDIFTKVDSFARQQDVQLISLISEKTVNRDINPFFSIIIPAYKRTELMINALNSAINQRDYQDYEIVIVDDTAIIENNPNVKAVQQYLLEREDLSGNYSDSIPPIHFFVNSRNVGVYANWNQCIKASKGEYIVMLHEDDLISPFMLSVLSKVIDKENKPELIGSNYQKLLVGDTFTFPECHDGDKIVYRQVHLREQFWDFPIIIAGMAFRRDFIIEQGGFNDKLYPNADNCYITQCIVKGSVFQIENILACSGVGSNDSLSGNTMEQIVTSTHMLRKQMVRFSSRLHCLVSLFETELLLDYIKNAVSYWKVDLSERQIIDEIGCREKSSRIRFALFKVIKKLYRYTQNHQKRQCIEYGKE